MRYAPAVSIAALNAPRARPAVRPCRRLTPAFVKKVCDLIERGVPQAVAAGSLGVPRRTFQVWLAKGRETDAVEPYVSLAEKLEEAVDRFHMSRAVIVGESTEDRTALEVLRRRFKDDWADPDRGGSTVNVNVTLELERRATAEAILAAAVRVLADDPEKFEALIAEIAGPAVVDGEAVEVLALEP